MSTREICNSILVELSLNYKLDHYDVLHSSLRSYYDSIDENDVELKRALISYCVKILHVESTFLHKSEEFARNLVAEAEPSKLELYELCKQRL